MKMFPKRPPCVGQRGEGGKDVGNGEAATLLKGGRESRERGLPILVQGEKKSGTGRPKHC